MVVARRQGRRQARQGRARSSGAQPAGRARSARTDAAPPRGGVSVVVEGLNIAKRHTKPRQSAERQRPDAQGPAGRHPGHRPAACRSARSWSSARQLRQPTRIAHAVLDTGRRVRVCAALRRAAGGEVVTSRLQERYKARSCRRSRSSSSTPTRTRCRGLDKIVVNIGLGEALTNAKALDAAVGDLSDDHRPEADRHQGQAVDRPVPRADGQLDRGQGHPPRRADVGLPGAPDHARPAAHPRLPGRPGRSRSTGGATTRSGCASSSRSPRSTTTRWTVSAGWRSAS